MLIFRFRTIPDHFTWFQYLTISVVKDFVFCAKNTPFYVIWILLWGIWKKNIFTFLYPFLLISLVFDIMWFSRCSTQKPKICFESCWKYVILNVTTERLLRVLYKMVYFPNVWILFKLIRCKFTVFQLYINKRVFWFYILTNIYFSSARFSGKIAVMMHWQKYCHDFLPICELNIFFSMNNFMFGKSFILVVCCNMKSRNNMCFLLVK